jgi:hypothetical protein
MGANPNSAPEVISPTNDSLGSLDAEFPAGLYLAGNPLFDLCFNPADRPGPQRHWPWEFPFGDTLINGAA